MGLRAYPPILTLLYLSTCLPILYSESINPRCQTFFIHRYIGFSWVGNGHRRRVRFNYHHLTEIYTTYTYIIIIKSSMLLLAVIIIVVTCHQCVTIIHTLSDLLHSVLDHDPTAVIIIFYRVSIRRFMTMCYRQSARVHLKKYI